MVKLDLPYLWVTTGRHGRRRYWFYRRNGRFIPISCPGHVEQRIDDASQCRFRRAPEPVALGEVPWDHQPFGIGAIAGILPSFSLVVESTGVSPPVCTRSLLVEEPK